MSVSIGIYAAVLWLPVATHLCRQRQEIAAGRMSPDDELAKGAEEAMSAPHFTRAELIARADQKPGAQPQETKRSWFGWFKSK